MRVCLWLSCFVLGLLATSPADQRRLKLKTAEPVVPELMGGCSMRCTFRWNVTVAQRGKIATTALLNDEKPETSWVAPDDGTLPILRLAFPKRLPAEMEGQVPFYGIDFVNGNWVSEEKFAEHARLKKARLSYNGKELGVLEFADTRRWQRLEFDDIMVHSGDVLSLEVLEVYPGTSHRGVAISEIVLQGAH